MEEGMYFRVKGDIFIALHHNVDSFDRPIHTHTKPTKKNLILFKNLEAVTILPTDVLKSLYFIGNSWSLLGTIHLQNYYRISVLIVRTRLHHRNGHKRDNLIALNQQCYLSDQVTVDLNWVKYRFGLDLRG